MAEFINPFTGVVPDRTLTLRELTRAIRQSLAAEEEATHLYEAIADATDNELVRTVLQDIADEERVHSGEFRRLLCLLLPDEARLQADGAAEVDEMAAAANAGRIAPAENTPNSRPTVGGLREEKG